MSTLALPGRKVRAGLAFGVVGIAWLAAVAVGTPWYVVVVPPLAVAALVLLQRRALLADRDERLREATELCTRLEDAADLARVGMWHWDVRLARVHYDRRCSAMLGYADGEIASSLSAWGKLVHPDDLPLARGAIDALIDGSSAQYEARVRLRAADGTWRTILDRGRVTARDDRGRATRAVGIHLDVTATVVAKPPVVTRGRWVIVDDDDSVRTVIETAARRLGLDVVSFADPQLAWEAIGAGPPIGIITDYEMPGMSGLQLAERVRAAGMGCPLLLVTGAASSPSLSECRSIDGLLDKPFSIAKLEAWLSRHAPRASVR
jgi:CheY-like chemotaxis protein/PAS domain-containing protein